MKTKIIACDYDGTLFQEDGTGISEADRDAIVRFREAGGIFGIVTGRDMTACEIVLENLRGMLDYLICSSGAIICDGEGSITNEFTSNKVGAISKLANYSLGNNVDFFNMIYHKTRYSLDVSNKRHDFDNVKEFNNCTVWYKTPKDAMVAEEYIRANFNDDITYFRNYQCIEITPLGVTKASGIKDFIKNIKNPLVFTIGDGITDASMIKEFYGFAIGNANPDLKKIAKRECKCVCDLIDFVLRY